MKKVASKMSFSESFRKVELFLHTFPHPSNLFLSSSLHLLSIHPSMWAVDPRQRFASPPGSHTRHAPLWCLARLPALISFPHPPQVTILTCPPLLTPTPTSRPQQPPQQPPPPSLHPPARPNMPSIICPTYPPSTSPALPPISLPLYAPPVQLLT